MAKRIAYVLIVLALLAGGFAAVERYPAVGSPRAPVSETETSAAFPITLTVGTTTYRVSVPARASVLDAMRAAEPQGFAFSGTKYPSLGMFVESLNGKANVGGSYWFLYVNGKSSETGASQTILKPGDAIEWRYEKSH